MVTEDIQKHFPSLEKELIEEIATVSEMKEMQEGELLMRTGQNIRTAILVVDGLVKIYRENGEGDEYFIYYLEPGKACAVSLVCALGKETSGILAKAVIKSTVLIIPAYKVNEWMGKYKSWAQFAVNTYRERFEEILHVLDQTVFRNMDERLVFYLKRYRETYKTHIISMPFSELAQEVNSSREVISRLMKKLSEKGVVELHGSYVKLLNLDKALG
jgi:CRP/FNR family transcriptional regulator, anaerobic regulatory protein